MVGSMIVDAVTHSFINLILVISPAALKIQSFPAMRALHESRGTLSVSAGLKGSQFGRFRASHSIEIHLPAVALDEAEGVQLSRVAFIHKRPEVTPVDLKTLARRRLHAHEGAPGFRLCSHCLQVIFDNGV